MTYAAFFHFALVLFLGTLRLITAIITAELI
jgi:hypothetical protein